LVPLALWAYPFETTSSHLWPVLMFVAVVGVATVRRPRIALRGRVVATT
jgi:hypothetical protein